MAVSRGQLITADAVNTLNGNATITVSMPSGADHVQDYIGNSGCFYSHRVSGQRMLYFPSIKCGVFGGGHAAFEMWVDGAWQSLKTWSWSWNTNTSIDEASRGPGYYRFRSTDNWAMNAITGYIYCGDVNCTRGNLIRLGDVWTANNGGYISGGSITADLANTNYRIVNNGH